MRVPHQPAHSRRWRFSFCAGLASPSGCLPFSPTLSLACSRWSQPDRRRRSGSERRSHSCPGALPERSSLTATTRQDAGSGTEVLIPRWQPNDRAAQRLRHPSAAMLRTSKDVQIHGRNSHFGTISGSENQQMNTAKKKRRDREKSDEKADLKAAQVELVKLERHVIETGQKILVILEGRDAAGKDGTIKRIIEHLSPREARMVALGKPSNRNRRAWYFQRYVKHLPVAGEIVLFNRSWYNRAGVERVMKFCSKEEHETFLKTAPMFEDLLVHCGITIVKYYLDISKDEQKKRLKERQDDPLTQWKTSPIDAVAVKHWEDYSDARDEMLARTHSIGAPWTIVRADDKPKARINLIRDLLTRLDFKGKDRKANLPDLDVVFSFSESAIRNGLLAK
jgi:polyphosphate kinase 2